MDNVRIAKELVAAAKELTAADGIDFNQEVEDIRYQLGGVIIAIGQGDYKWCQKTFEGIEKAITKLKKEIVERSDATSVAK